MRVSSQTPHFPPPEDLTPPLGNFSSFHLRSTSPATDCGHEHSQGPLLCLHSSLKVFLQENTRLKATQQWKAALIATRRCSLDPVPFRGCLSRQEWAPCSADTPLIKTASSQVISSPIIWNISTSYTCSSQQVGSRLPGFPKHQSNGVSSLLQTFGGSRCLRIKSKRCAWPSRWFSLQCLPRPCPPRLHTRDPESSAPRPTRSLCYLHYSCPSPFPITPQWGSSHLPGEMRCTLLHSLFPIYHVGSQLMKTHVARDYLPHYTRSFVRWKLSLSWPLSCFQCPRWCFPRVNIHWLTDVLNLWLLLKQGVKSRLNNKHAKIYTLLFFSNYVAAMIHKTPIQWKVLLNSWLLFATYSLHQWRLDIHLHIYTWH